MKPPGRFQGRRFLALGTVIAVIAVLLAGIGVAAVIAIQSGIHDATVAPHVELTEQFNAIDLPDSFTLVRTEKGGSVAVVRLSPL